MNLRPRHQGFTLIEIIVVVLVFSVMAAMAYGGLNSVLRTRSAIETSMDRTADLQRAFLRLRGDFQNLRDRPARDLYGDAQAPLTFSREGELNLVRGGWRSPLHSSRSSLERVRYELRDGALRRATWKVVDLPQQVEPTELTLLKDVEEARWRFLDSAREWREQWPDSAQATLAPGGSEPAPPPLAVELTLVTRDWGELRFVFRTPQAGLARASADTAGGVEPGSDLLTREGLLPAALLGTAAGGVPDPDPDSPADPDDETPAPDEPAPDDGRNDGGGDPPISSEDES